MSTLATPEPSLPTQSRSVLLLCPPLAQQPPDPLAAEARDPGDQSRRLARVASSPDRGDQLLARLPELTLASLDLRSGAGDSR
jgi:hypothetical protein